MTSTNYLVHNIKNYHIEIYAVVRATTFKSLHRSRYYPTYVYYLRTHD